MIEEIFSTNKISPDICEMPKEILIVRYEECTVNLGNKLTPTQVKNKPSVVYDGDPSIYYTLVMTDPDAPSRKEPIYGEIKHWLVVNIPGNNIEKGEVIADYIGSGAPKGTGFHRYIFLLYKQKQKIDASNEIRASNCSREGRVKWNVKEFSKKYNFEEPIYGNFFQAQYDDYVPQLHAQLEGGYRKQNK